MRRFKKLQCLKDRGGEWFLLSNCNLRILNIVRKRKYTSAYKLVLTYALLDEKHGNMTVIVSAVE